MRLCFVDNSARPGKLPTYLNVLCTLFIYGFYMFRSETPYSHGHEEG